SIIGKQSSDCKAFRHATAKSASMDRGCGGSAAVLRAVVAKDPRWFAPSPRIAVSGSSPLQGRRRRLAVDRCE
ncbi:hypothetical protein ABTJ92_22705, partial [Acinetobacter baumannii]